MKVEHIAVGSNSEEDSDKFFMEFLGLKRIRTKLVPAGLIEQFFGVKRENKFVLYGNEELLIEVFITNDNSKAQDTFTHSCVLIENRDGLVSKASSMGYDIVKVPRNDGNGYYLFVRDSFHNLYEIKEK
ncbi:MAG: VOC family protein [Candidatus Thorarchaeota archaeon]